MLSQTVIDMVDNTRMDLHKIMMISTSEYYKGEFSLELNQHLCELGIFLSNQELDIDNMLMIIEKDFIPAPYSPELQLDLDFNNNPDSDSLITMLQNLATNFYRDIKTCSPDYETAYVNKFRTDGVAEVHIATVD